MAEKEVNNAAESDYNDFRSGIIRKTDYFDLFISYKRDNGGDNGQKLAIRLHKDLTAMGFKVWLDNEEIGFSRDFEKRIEEAILHSKKLACVLSPLWLASENCRYEYLKALDFEKRIIPLHYRGFRDELRQQKDDGILSDEEWRKLDKPQEINFSEEAFYQNALKDLAAICRLKDDITEKHTKILCDAYYWKNFDKPEGALLRGTRLTKVKRLKQRCDGDEESPTFAALQNEFLDASSAFVSSENTRKRKVFLDFSENDRSLASELDLELRINNISTWFDEYTSKDQVESEAIDAIINCETIVHVTNVLGDDDDLKLAYARSNNKRIIQITRSEDVLKAHQEKGESNFYLWAEGTALDAIITTINGDAKHVASHAALLEKAIIWENADKADNKLLYLREANTWKEWIEIADREKSDPKPTPTMFEFVQRSVIYSTAQVRRKRMAYWTTLIGIVLLIGMTAGVLWLNYKVSQENARLFMLKVDQFYQVLDSKRQKAVYEIQKAEFAKEKNEVEKQKAQLALDNQNLEENIRKSLNALDAANDSIAKAQARSDELDKEAERLAQKAKNAQDAYDLAQQQFNEVQEQKKILSNFISGNRKAIAAYQDIRFQQEKTAAAKADSARILLADAGASNQIQPLYEVGKRMVKDNTGYSTNNRQNPKKLDSLLQKMNRNRKDLYPASETKVSQQDLVQIAGMLGKETRSIALGRRAPKSNVVAIAYKNGAVDLVNLYDTTIVKNYRNHTHRVTDVVFNRAETYICVASIDNTFSVIPLDATRRNFGEAEIIEESSDMRITSLYFLDNDVVIGVSDLGARAWGIDVNELLKLVADEH